MQQVLVVDDERSISDGLAALFELEEISAEVAYDRESAENLIERQFYPVIIADLRLKTEADGMALLDAIRRLSPNSRVASLTAFATEEVEAELIRRGSAMVLRKPMEFDAIIEIVAEMLREIADAALEQQAATGSIDFQQLYDDVRRVLVAIPQRRFGLTPEETDEIVQEAWLLFLAKKNEILSARAWLTGTIANLSRQQIQRNCRGREIGTIYKRETEDETTVTDATAEQLMVRQALSRLDDRARALCELIGMEGWSYDEVSQELGLPIGSVGPLYIRAKAKMRKILETEH